MSPSRFYPDQQVKINGTRPTPLKINKDSHLIQKPSLPLNSSSFTGISAPSTRQQRHPVIIYTHSPKIIHTNVRDFMSLVQKLTGMQHSDQDSVKVSSSEGINMMGGNVGNEDTTSSSVVTDENCSGGVADVQVNSSSVSPAFDPINSCLTDIPLFTPNSSDFFSSSRPYYRYPDPMFTPSNMNSAISPSVLEVMKGYPNYYN